MRGDRVTRAGWARAGSEAPPGSAPAGAPESRAATDALLEALRSEGWSPRSWARFVLDTTTRSFEQARAHPRAVAEVSALHAAFTVVAGRERWRWVATSWIMGVTHLGMLGPRRSIGSASVVTMARANLPAVSGDWPWLGVVAICSDKADGILARRVGPTQFGQYADSLADASFWAWFAIRHETDRRLLATAALAWLVPVATVSVASFAKGAMVEAPRSALIRPAAAMQAVLAVRALRSGSAGCSRRVTVGWRP